MALVVETGAGVDGSNTYVSLEDAQAFVDARELAVTLTAGLILRAMDALSAVNLKPFSGTVPDGVVKAQIWLAYYISIGNDPAQVSEPAVRMEKVDVLETEFAVVDGQVTTYTPLSLPNVRDSLSGLLLGSGVLDRA